MVLCRLAHHTTLPVTYSNLVLEDHRLVNIDWSTVLLRTVGLQAIYVPVHRNLNLVPSRYVIISLEEIQRTLPWVGNPVEVPCAVERHVVLTVLGKHLACTLLVRESKEPSLRLLLVQSKLLGRLPLDKACRLPLLIAVSARCLYVTVSESLQILRIAAH